MNFSGIISIVFGIFVVVIASPFSEGPALAKLTKGLERLIMLEPEKPAKKILVIYGAVMCLIGGLSFFPGLLVTIVSWVQDYIYYLIAAIFVFALIPPFIKWLESRKGKNCATLRSVFGNLGFNLAGALAASASLWAASLVIKDYWGIYRLDLSTAISFIMAACVWIAFAYQKAEQSNPDTNDPSKKPDAYDPSLKWKNQILNIIHLVNVYFFSLLSGFLLFTYSYYCYSHGHKPALTWEIYIQLSIILIFFYMCARNKMEHVYLLFLETVPILLFLFVLWFSWFEYNGRGTAWFIAGHFCFYLIAVLLKERTRGRLKLFNVIVPIVAFSLMIVVLYTSQSVERIPLNQARNHLSLIGMEDHVEDVEALLFFDSEKQDIDSAVFMDYLNRTYKTRLEQIGCYPASVENLNNAFLTS